MFQAFSLVLRDIKLSVFGFCIVGRPNEVFENLNFGSRKF